MKKNLFTTMAFVSLLAAATFCACSKDDDENNTSTISGEYSVKVEGDSHNSEIDTVRLVIYYDNGSYTRKEVCSEKYDKGKFTLDLSGDISNTYLVAIDESFDEDEDFPDGITVSNSKVKIGTANLEAYKWNSSYGSGYSNYVGSFYHGTVEWDGELVYANGDVSVTGSGEVEDDDDYRERTYLSIYKYNMHLKKGWNIVYTKRTVVETAIRVANTYEITTQAPAGAVWRFSKY
jgi:hypothetical protein